MTSIVRRNFLKVGLAGAAGTTLLSGAPNIAHSYPLLQTKEELDYLFGIEMGMTHKLSPLGRHVLSSSPWALTSDREDLIPNLFEKAAFSNEDIATAARKYLDDPVLEIETAKMPARMGREERTGVIEPSSITVLEALSEVRVQGAPDLSDLMGAGFSLLKEGAVNFSLEFTANQSAEWQPQTFSLGGLPVIGFQRGELFKGTDAPAGISAPPSINIGNLRFQFRGPDNHPLGSCVTTNVRHFNMEMFIRRSNGRYRYLANIHLGTYTNGGRRCFVAYLVFNINGRAYRYCFRACGPTRDELTKVLIYALAAVLTAAGIAIAAWLLAAIAEVISLAMFPFLLVL